jgi:hypothetical protein
VRFHSGDREQHHGVGLELLGRRLLVAYARVGGRRGVLFKDSIERRIHFAAGVCRRRRNNGGQR